MFAKTTFAFGLTLLAMPLSAAPAKPAVPMQLPAIQARAIALGIQPTEFEIKGMIAEVEGTDAQGRKVELVLDRRTGEVLFAESFAWIAAAHWQPRAGQPLPLSTQGEACSIRAAAVRALDRAGIAWRIAFSSASLAGTWAAVSAGLGVGVRTPLGLPGSVQAVTAKESGLPALPTLGLSLHRAEAEPAPAVAQLARIVVRALGAR